MLTICTLLGSKPNHYFYKYLTENKPFYQTAEFPKLRSNSRELGEKAVIQKTVDSYAQCLSKQLRPHNLGPAVEELLS